MDLKEIRNELHKLSELVDGWQDLSGVAALERDWALEKLRSIYEVLRFGVGQAAGTVAPGAGKPEAEIEPIAPGVVELPDAHSIETAVHEDAPAASAVGRRVEADPALEVIDLADEPEPQIAPVAEPARGAVAFDEPHVEPEPIPADVQQQTEVQQYSGSPAQVAEWQPHSEPLPAFEPQSAPVQRPEPELSEPETPTLFGPDDKKELHRRKQRVIMSLYDTAPDGEMPEQAEESAAARPTSVGRRKAAAGGEPEIVLLDAYTEEPVEESRSKRAERSVEAPMEIPVAGFEGLASETYDPAELQGDPEQVPLDIEVLQEDFAAPAGTVLGEVINHDVQTLADTIAAPGFGRYGEPIADLRQAIGINDKFLMIRDLFGGDSALFETTIAALNAQPGLDDCMIYIAEHFAWNPDSESARLMMELLERKFA